MRVRYHSEAADEREAAAAWYESRHPFLGDEFQAEVRAAQAAIAENPYAWPHWPGLEDLSVRHRVLDRFPYSLPYLIRGDTEAVILAVAHGKRRPGRASRF